MEAGGVSLNSFFLNNQSKFCPEDEEIELVLNPNSMLNTEPFLTSEQSMNQFA